MKIDVVLSEGLPGSCSPDVLGALVIVSPPDPLSPLASSWFLLAAFWDFTSDFAEFFHCFITTTPRPNPLRLGWGVVRRLSRSCFFFALDAVTRAGTKMGWCQPSQPDREGCLDSHGGLVLSSPPCVILPLDTYVQYIQYNTGLYKLCTGLTITTNNQFMDCSTGWYPESEF